MYLHSLQFLRGEEDKAKHNDPFTYYFLSKTLFMRMFVVLEFQNMEQEPLHSAGHILRSVLFFAGSGNSAHFMRQPNHHRFYAIFYMNQLFQSNRQLVVAPGELPTPPTRAFPAQQSFSRSKDRIWNKERCKAGWVTKEMYISSEQESLRLHQAI